MKFTIDTTNKTVKVEEGVNLSSLTCELTRLLGGEYGLYSIVPNYQPCTCWNAGGFTISSPIYSPPATLQGPFSVTCSAGQ